MGLANAVQFRHGLSTREIRELYARSAIAIIPSEYEGFGLPAGEAMACGVPVVSSDGGALPEVVGDAGVVVPAKDPHALATSVGMLLDNPDLRNDFARRGRQRIDKHFSWEQAARQMTRLYAKVMAT